MRPDDPRHGTNAGYINGCRQDCCRQAHANYRRGLRARRYLLRTDGLFVDPTPTRRRIQALQAIGWRYVDIDQQLGRHPTATGATWSHTIMRRKRIHISHAREMAAVYDALSMTLGPSDRTRRRALRSGWLPPLAWDDIDDLNEQGSLGPTWKPRSAVDEAVVDRILNGENVPSTKAEKCEVVRRWTGSLRELEALTGWRAERYKEAS